MWPAAFALAVFAVAGCGGGGGNDAPVAPGPGPGPVDPIGAVCAAGADCVPLGTAGNYVILAKDGGITTTGTSAVTGNVGMNAFSGSGGLTGFSETMDASLTFSTSAQVTGKIYAAEYADPTPADLIKAIADASAAFNDVDNNKTVGVGNLDLGAAGNITGLDFAPGVYEWTTGVTVDAASTVTLTGGPTDVWVFKIPAGITMGSGSTVTLAGGALPQNVFWRTGTTVALGTNANLKGVVLSGTSITLTDGASVDGRLIASTAVTLIHNVVTRP